MIKEPEDEEFERIEREQLERQERNRNKAKLDRNEDEKVTVLTHYYMKFCPSCRSLFADTEESND
jgi:hypothetical protein